MIYLQVGVWYCSYTCITVKYYDLLTLPHINSYLATCSGSIYKLVYEINARNKIGNNY